MYPVLKPGDLLFTEPCDRSGPRKGDVILFRQPGARRFIVHRVAGVGPDGIVAKGDNNDRRDVWTIQRDLVTGRVVSLARGGRRMPVHGGTRGRLLGMRAAVLKALNRNVSRILGRPCRMLARFAPVKRVVSLLVKPGILVFRKAEGEEALLTFGRSGNVIGRRPPGEKRWRIRRPFRLFIDEAALNSALEERRLLSGHTGADIRRMEEE
jgi:hypothetical protein